MDSSGDRTADHEQVVLRFGLGGRSYLRIAEHTLPGGQRLFLGQSFLALDQKEAA